MTRRCLPDQVSGVKYIIPLGWEPAAFSEIEAFPRAVLAHHYPDVPCHGDFTTIGAEDYGPIDLIVGGTPCQDYSIAGLREGLVGERGNLTLEFSRLAYRKRARWLVWENVPGVFSTNQGRDFGAILATFSGRHGHVFTPPRGGWRNSGVVEPAHAGSFGLAWRVLDAQHFGVPQRRRRIFVVGYLGDWRRAAAVLLERQGLQGHPAPRREAREGVAKPIAAGSRSSGGYRNDADTADNLIAFDGQNLAECTEVSATLDSGAAHSNRGMHVAATVSSKWAKGSGGPSGGPSGDECQNLVLDQPISFNSREDCCSSQDVFGSLGSSSPQSQAVAFAENIRGEIVESDVARALQTSGGKPGQGYAATRVGSSVRRLTPRECERLQGFPDDYTLIVYRRKPASDGPRYKALGNSMPRPVMEWIGERIDMVEALAA